MRQIDRLEHLDKHLHLQHDAHPDTAHL
jgi:hypothetical protein